jgi:hypothetical protein
VTSWLRRPSVRDRGVIYLVLLIVGLGTANLLWTSHVSQVSQQQSRQATRTAIVVAIASNNKQWCDSLGVLTSGPPPPPVQVTGVRLYRDFVTLEKRFECQAQ